MSAYNKINDKNSYQKTIQQLDKELNKQHKKINRKQKISIRRLYKILAQLLNVLFSHASWLHVNNHQKENKPKRNP